MLGSLNVLIGSLFASTAGTGTRASGTTITSGDIKIDGIGPDPGGLPGANVAVTITNGIMFFSLLFCLVGLVLSAGLWAVGAFSNNYTQSVNGKKGFLICAGAALAIGAAFFLVSWFFGAGNKVA
jgi:hypothetical protein